MRILRGQKEQTVNVKLGKFPSGKELAKVESGKPAIRRAAGDRAGSARARRVAPGTGADKDGVVVTDVDNASDAAAEGHQVGRRDPRGRRHLAVKSPDDVANGIKEASQARPQGRAGARQVGRADALRRRPAEEELTLRSSRVSEASDGEAASLLRVERAASPHLCSGITASAYLSLHPTCSTSNRRRVPCVCS